MDRERKEGSLLRGGKVGEEGREYITEGRERRERDEERERERRKGSGVKGEGENTLRKGEKERRGTEGGEERAQM